MADFQLILVVLPWNSNIENFKNGGTPTFEFQTLIPSRVKRRRIMI